MVRCLPRAPCVACRLALARAECRRSDARARGGALSPRRAESRQSVRDGAVGVILDTRGRAESKTNTPQFNLTQSTDRARRSGVHETLHLYTRALGLLGQRASVHSLPVHP